MSDKREIRSVAMDQIDLRSDTAPSAQRYVEGIAIVFDKETEIVEGQLYESIAPDAFTESLTSGKEIRCYFNHNYDQILASTRSDPPLVIEVLDKGVFFSAPICPTGYGNDLVTNLQRKNIAGCSFGFYVTKDSVTESNGTYHRRIEKGEVFEISPCINPAYSATTVSLRDKETLLDEVKARTLASDAVNLTETRNKETEYKRNLMILLELEQN